MVSRQLKMVWEFRGPTAEKTAEHHVIHLNDFFKMQDKTHLGTGVEVFSESAAIAFVIINEEDMALVRDRLKPHKAFVHND